MLRAQLQTAVANQLCCYTRLTSINLDQPHTQAAGCTRLELSSYCDRHLGSSGPACTCQLAGRALPAQGQPESTLSCTAAARARFRHPLGSVCAELVAAHRGATPICGSPRRRHGSQAQLLYTSNRPKPAGRDSGAGAGACALRGKVLIAPRSWLKSRVHRAWRAEVARCTNDLYSTLQACSTGCRLGPCAMPGISTCHSVACCCGR